MLAKNIIATRLGKNVPAAGLTADVGKEEEVGLVSETAAGTFICHSAEETLGRFLFKYFHGSLIGPR